MSNVAPAAAPEIGNKPPADELDIDSKPDTGSGPSPGGGLDGANKPSAAKPPVQLRTQDTPPVSGMPEPVGSGSPETKPLPVVPTSLFSLDSKSPPEFTFASDSPLSDSADLSGTPFEAATVEEWRMCIGQGGSSMDLAAYSGQSAVGELGPDNMLSGLSGAIAEHAGMSGAFTIEMPRLGTIDGYVQVEPGHANVWLSPRNAATRQALQRARGDVEREASRHAGFDINLMIV